MGKVSALALTEEEKQVEFFSVPVGSSIVNFRRNPSSADNRRHLPLGGRFLGAPKDEWTTATTQLSTINYVGYSLSANVLAAVS